MAATAVGYASRRTCALATASLVAATLLYAAPLLRLPRNLSHWDWDKEFALAEAQRRAILRDGQMPLWNSHQVGGVALFGFHESIVLAPEFPLVLAFGAVVGMKLRIVVAYLIGVLATSALGRLWGLHPWAAAFAAAVAMLSGYLASHLWFGQPMWMAMAWLPAAMLALHRDRRRPGLLALSFLLMFFEGGLDVLFMSMVMLLMVVLVEAALGDGGGLRAFALGLVGFGCLGAAKVIPAAAFISRAPRPIQDVGLGWLHQMRGVRQLWVALASREFERDLPWSRGQWEDMAYVGVVALVLGLAGMAIGRRRLRPFSIGATFCFLLAMGDGGVPGLWSAFHSLPAVEQFEYPLRFAGVGAVPLALFAGFCLTRMGASPRRALHWLAIALGLAAVASPYLSTRAILEMIFWNPPPAGLEPGPFVQWRPATRYMDYPSVLLNRGNIRGLLATHPPVKAVAIGDADYRGEAWILSGRGTARIVERTTNRLSLETIVPGADRVIVNMNHAPGWRVDGRPASSEGGLLAADVGAGSSRLRFVYAPADYRVGLFVSLASILGLLTLRLVRAPGSRA